MKNWLIKISRPLLTSAMLIGGWICIDCTSVILFGEYEYPAEH